jgi:hypothetical protein
MQPWETKLEDPKELMIEDMRRVLKIAPDCTRNFYRGRGRFREADWSYFWPTFKAFVRAAKTDER